MKVFSAAQFYEADKRTTEKEGISSLDLMERAGQQVFQWLHQRMQGAQVHIHIFCGIGNNGGDGLVVGRLLIEHGYQVTIYIANFTDKRSKCFLINYDRVKEVTKKWPVLMRSAADFPEIAPQDIIVDALFGIGINRPPEGWVKELIQFINAQKAFTLSIDMPSGLYANEAIEDSEAIVKANHTLTFQAPKLAFFLPETGAFVPYFEAIDIGLDPEYLHTTHPLARVILKPEAQRFYQQREKYAHKGTFGHVLIVGGSYGKLGAPQLAAKAAYRSGAGLVTAYIPACGFQVFQTAQPEVMTLTDPNEHTLSEAAFDLSPTTMAVGMGMGTTSESSKALASILEKAEGPIVLDADALNLIVKDHSLWKQVPKHSVLTPHPGELERLVGAWKNDYEKIEKVQALSKEFEVIVVVKGANSLTVLGDDVYINSTGNPGMATGGAGDVLAGMLAGLIAQGYDPLMATIFGIYLHGSAGNLGAQEHGFEALMAGDIIEYIGDAFLELFRQEEPQPSAEERKK
ncbi:NAD(P)H-hydrate dehydratase [Altibacter sp. HG106]|uniref:NAD(P)H-hydrate dehydratase n=1 Tax=Altibacter sp. HG106 TaxID=3023937 RepID=UPI002350DB07|nr:NAD(P)H-hydrate dehydratase [Altibacter sp. HG106]MDC7996234.1 NAD(P)H-hydrate dehydratase [Altibacter sp. HG106]